MSERVSKVGYNCATKRKRNRTYPHHLHSFDEEPLGGPWLQYNLRASRTTAEVVAITVQSIPPFAQSRRTHGQTGLFTGAVAESLESAFSFELLPLVPTQGTPSREYVHEYHPHTLWSSTTDSTHLKKVRPREPKEKRCRSF